MVRITRKGDSSADSQLSSLGDKEESDFISRMRLCSDKIGSVNALARKSGIAQSTVRRYLEGGEPGRPHLIAIAEAAGVDLIWLATGRGASGAQRVESEPLTPDMDLLEQVISKTERMLARKEKKASPEAKAKVVRMIYEYCLRQESKIDEKSLDNVIEFAAYRAA
ncbi:helix-turn-helix domain-containing protein [Eoetvoesiella caeni]